MPRSVLETFTEEFAPTDDDDVTCSVDWVVTDIFHGSESAYIQLTGFESIRALNWTQRVSFEKWQLREAKPLKGVSLSLQPPPMTTCDAPAPNASTVFSTVFWY